MPVTFGSVGDIISVCLLVKDLVDALDKARGSKAEYQSLIRELWILDRSLLEIDLLARTHGGGATPELDALCKTARKAVDRCRELVSVFSTRIQKYQKSLGENGAASFIESTAMKVRWHIGEKDAVDKFRAEIAATSASLQMLLATASVKLIDINGRKVKDHMTTVQQQHEASIDKQGSVLISINAHLEDANRQIASGNSVTAKLADALRLDWLRQLGTELKGYMRRIISMNIATYHAVLSIQSALPGRLERGLIEEPFILEDAIGRIAPVHLQFVTSWDAFHAVLEIRFREMQGLKKVQQKQYGLQEKASKRDVEQSRPWQRAFLPGQRIEMSFLFDAQDKEGGTSAVTCPGCQTPSTNPTEAEIQCENCRMWFRRITIVQDVEPQPQTPMPSPWRSKSEFGKPAFTATVLGPVKPGRKRVAPTDVDGEVDLREFKRVRLILRKERARLQAFEKRKGGVNLKTFSTLSSGATSETSAKIWKIHRGNQTQTSEALRWKSAGVSEISKDAVTDQPIDLAEIVKEELLRAREAGLVSKAIPGTNPDTSSRKGRLVPKTDSHRVAPAEEKFWDPKWFPEPKSRPIFARPMPTPFPAKSPPFPAKSQQSSIARIPPVPSGFYNPMNDGKRPDISWHPPQEDHFEIDWGVIPIERHLYTSVPFSESHPLVFYHLDPSFLTVEQVKAAIRTLAITIRSQVQNSLLDAAALSRTGKPEDFIWPMCSLSIYISTTRLLGIDSIDWAQIASAEVRYGTPFSLPKTNTALYGPAIGRWIFDWTCHFYDDAALVHTALDTWQSIYLVEKNFFSAIYSRRGWGKHGMWNISEEVDLYFSHFVVCYRCFWWQLCQSMTGLQWTDDQGFNGVTSPNIKAYAKAFLTTFFYPPPSNKWGRYPKFIRLLDLCSRYFASGFSKLESLEKPQHDY